MTPPRAVDLARLTIGTLALGRPQTLLMLSPGDDSDGTRRVVRILGARYVIQAVGGALARRPWVPAADASVDLIHAASMAGIATLAPRHRRLTTVSLGAAVVFAAADLCGGRPPRATNRSRTVNVSRAQLPLHRRRDGRNGRSAPTLTAPPLDATHRARPLSVGLLQPRAPRVS